EFSLVWRQNGQQSRHGLRCFSESAHPRSGTYLANCSRPYLGVRRLCQLIRDVRRDDTLDRITFTHSHFSFQSVVNQIDAICMTFSLQSPCEILLTPDCAERTESRAVRI